MTDLFNEQSEVSQDSLELLSDLCNKQRTLAIEIEGIEQSLKNKKEELEKVSREYIPELFDSIGVSKLTLSSGEEVIVEDKIKASISNKNYVEAYRNMVNAEGGDVEAEERINALFKSEIVIDENEMDEEVFDYLLENDVAYESKKSIHHQTLSKYCRTKLESGEKIPEGISVYQYRETKIK